MDNSELRSIYDTYLDSGELEEVMPESTGIWEKDRIQFKLIHESLSKLIDDEEFIDDLNSSGSNWKEFVDDLLGRNDVDDPWSDII